MGDLVKSEGNIEASNIGNVESFPHILVSEFVSKIPSAKYAHIFLNICEPIFATPLML